MPIQFLNNISNKQAADLKSKIVTKKYELLINPANVAKAISLEELNTLTSDTLVDGKLFYICLVDYFVVSHR